MERSLITKQQIPLTFVFTHSPSSSVQMLGLPLLSSSWTSKQPSLKSLHHSLTSPSLTVVGPYVSHNWQWISEAIYPLVFRNLIIVWTSQLARLFIFALIITLSHKGKSRQTGDRTVEDTAHAQTNQCLQSIFTTDQPLLLKYTSYIKKLHCINKSNCILRQRINKNKPIIYDQTTDQVSHLNYFENEIGHDKTNDGWRS